MVVCEARLVFTTSIANIKKHRLQPLLITGYAVSRPFAGGRKRKYVAEVSHSLDAIMAYRCCSELKYLCSIGDEHDGPCMASVDVIIVVK